MSSLWPPLLALAIALVPVRAAPEASDPRQDCHATAFIGTAYRDRGGAEYSTRSEVGAYADGYATPATGRLFTPDDDVGCSSWPPDDRDGPWIALVRRGGCSIETKIENALRSQATGLIIYSNRDSLNLSKARVTKQHQGTISVVFTYKWKGDELKTLLSTSLEITIDLSIANPCVKININTDRNMQLFSISFLCFIVLTISLAWMIFYYVQRYKDLQARDRKVRGYSEADEKALKAIPTKTIKANDKLITDESECCAICIDPYKQSEVVRILTCSHEFHKECIDPWLLENRTCPMCKKDILRHYGSVFLGSQESIIQVVADEAARLAGPSSPAPHEIQVVIVGGALDDVSETSRAASPVSEPNELQILTERVQPVNTDVTYVGASGTTLAYGGASTSAALSYGVSSGTTLAYGGASSSASLVTVDSAQEALCLVENAESCDEIREDDDDDSPPATADSDDSTTEQSVSDRVDVDESRTDETCDES